MKKFVNNEKVTKVCETAMLNEDNKILLSTKAIKNTICYICWFLKNFWKDLYLCQWSKNIILNKSK